MDQTKVGTERQVWVLKTKHNKIATESIQNNT